MYCNQKQRNWFSKIRPLIILIGLNFVSRTFILSYAFFIWDIRNKSHKFTDFHQVNKIVHCLDLSNQLHRHLCRVAGQYDPNDPSRPLHRCDIYRSKAAGNVLKEIMKYGSSLTWNEVLSRATNENRLDGTAVRDFFRPLEEWLRNENLRTQEYPGWIYDGDYCKHSIETAGLYVRGGYYNRSSFLRSNNVLVILLIIFIMVAKINLK